MLSREEDVQLGQFVSEFLKGGRQGREDVVGRGAPKEVLRGETVGLL